MNTAAIIHESKSAQAYAVDGRTLHIRVKTAKGEVTKSTLLAVDPFNWIPRGDGSPIYDFDIQSIRHIPMKVEQSTREYDSWFCEVGEIDWGRTKYCFILENKEEKILWGCHGAVSIQKEMKKEEIYNLSNYFNYPYINEEDIYHAPQWVKDIVWYQIFPERFCNGTPDDERDVLPWGSDVVDGAEKKFGGNLEGVISKLDYLKEMGIGGIYLNPIFSSPSSHKYDIQDYYKIDLDFGNNEIFSRLVKEAHKRNIRIMLDAVFNHCGYFHPFWQDVLTNGKNSKYYECFYIVNPDKPLVYREENGEIPNDCPRDVLNYRTFAYTQNMPKWNTGHPLVREYLLDVACYWIREYGIDGWRLDVSNEVSHDFWREFRKRVKEINPDTYILGENWDNSYPWLRGDQFDAVMNYEFVVPVWNFFGKNRGGEDYTAEDFQNAIGNLLIEYPQNVTNNLLTLIESHDTSRMLELVGGNKQVLRLAYLFLMTFPGSPCIYYGSEVGLSGGEHSNRQCMIWEENEQDRELLLDITKMITLRKEHEALRAADFCWKHCTKETNTIVYEKKAGRERIYVILNNSERIVQIPVPKELDGKKTEILMSDGVKEKKDIWEIKAYGFSMMLLRE